nr:MAG TPA: Nucleotide modification associated domain 5 [Caudoviricetes sp.]
MLLRYGVITALLFNFSTVREVLEYWPKSTVVLQKEYRSTAKGVLRTVIIFE